MITIIDVEKVIDKPVVEAKCRIIGMRRLSFSKKYIESSIHLRGTIITI